MKPFLLIAMLFAMITATAQFSESFETPYETLVSKGWSFQNTWSISSDAPVNGTSSLLSGNENFQTYTVTTSPLTFKSTGFFTFQYAFTRVSTQTAMIRIDLVDKNGKLVQEIGGINPTPTLQMQQYVFPTNWTGTFSIRITYHVNNSNSGLKLDELNHSAAVILPVTWEKIWVDRKPSFNQLFWTVEEYEDTDRYEVQFSTDAINFRTIQVVKASGTKQRKTYSITHNVKQ